MGEEKKTTAQIIAEYGILPDKAKYGYVRIPSNEAELSAEKRSVYEMPAFEQAEESDHADHRRHLLPDLKERYEKLRNQFGDREQELLRLLSERNALAEREKRLSQDLSQKEVEVQRDRAELRAQFAEREASLRKEMENQQIALSEREATFRAQSH